MSLFLDLLIPLLDWLKNGGPSFRGIGFGGFVFQFGVFKGLFLILEVFTFSLECGFLFGHTNSCENTIVRHRPSHDGRSVAPKTTNDTCCDGGLKEISAGETYILELNPRCRARALHDIM